MSLLTLRNVTVSFGGPPLLESVNLTLNAGERLCLVGRNGTGKSTLLKLLNGDIQADGGEVIKQQGLNITRLTQEVPHGLGGLVFDVVAEGLGKQGDLLAQYHEISNKVATSSDAKWLNQLERLQHELEACNGWQLNQRVETVITRLSLPGEAEFSNLSGGMKRRVLLARALVSEPDLLLLDEPTNHLDIESIAWLEEFFLSWSGTLLFITHDRQFLRRLATRIIEIDRGQLTSWPGNYDTYLQRKQETLEAEEAQNKLFDKKLAQEEVWIRQGIKARRTRNEGRVRALKQLREEYRQRRDRIGKARIQLQEGELSGKLVVDAENINYRYDGKPIVSNFSVTISRGDRIGILGPNGIGKTTLLRILLGQLQPQSGHIRLGTRLEPAYFDQHRSQLDEEASVLDNLAEGSDKVTINGQSRHVMSYLQDFLFSPERVRSPVKALSGGERNRLLLAKLFSKSSNLLILDEPTNDLDVETLELLEELLMDYQGTLLLVSHDREFINNIVTSTLVFEGDGKINEYVGGYDDWLRQRVEPPVDKEITPKRETASKKESGSGEKKQVKLSYKEQRELEALPQQIERLEEEQKQLHDAMSAADFYQKDSGQIAAANARLTELESELSSAYERWEELEEKLS